VFQSVTFFLFFYRVGFADSVLNTFYLFIAYPYTSSFLILLIFLLLYDYSYRLSISRVFYEYLLLCIYHYLFLILSYYFIFFTVYLYFSSYPFTTSCPISSPPPFCCFSFTPPLHFSSRPCFALFS
jgi:hypothetical protein